jgi:hypothetical protein
MLHEHKFDPSSARAFGQWGQTPRSAFDADNRPFLRWLGYQRARRTIPYFKMGKMVRYDPILVRQALEQRCLVTPRQRA